jgi:hypothetical protein
MQQAIASGTDREDIKKVILDLKNPAKKAEEDSHAATLEAYIRSIHETALQAVADASKKSGQVEQLQKIDPRLADKYDAARNALRQITITNPPTFGVI